MYKLTLENDQKSIEPSFVGRDVRRGLQSASVESKEGRATTMFNTFYKTFMSVRITVRERERRRRVRARVVCFVFRSQPEPEPRGWIV